ncbi:MAG: tetratricopeptide repeat protein, partial [Planctomycetota bacterium]
MIVLTIYFGLGKEIQTETEDSWTENANVDPYCNRSGDEILPGIYSGSCTGSYYPAKAEINLYGYVYDLGIPHRSMWELYLRLQMLMTFVHEVGHHYDFTCRISRGRWRGDSKDNIEIYAEHIQHKWLNEYVIPFLKKKYVEDVDALYSWTKKHVGLEIPLDLIAGDPRSTAKNGCIRAASLFDTAHAFQEFVCEIHSGKDVLKARLEFADQLHMADKYDLALTIIDLVLAEKPKYVKGITLKADVYEHLGKYNDAVDIAMRALSIDPNYVKAMVILLYSYKDMKKWEKVIEISDKILSQEKSYPWVLFYKATAYFEIGKYKEAEDIIRDIEKRNKRIPIMVQGLKEKLQN